MSDLRDMFVEMDAAADQVSPAGPCFLGYCEVEFRRLQKCRLPGLDRDEWRDLFLLWAETYLTKLRVRAAQTQARMTALVRERDRLLERRARAPQDHDAARLADVANEIAALVVAGRPPPPATVGRWV